MRHNGSVTWPASSMTTRSARSKPSQKCRRLLPLGQRAMALAWTRRALSAPARQVGSVASAQSIAGQRSKCSRRPATYQRGTVSCRQCARKRHCHQPMWRASTARPWSCEPEWCKWGLQRRCVFSRCSFDRRRRHRLIVIRRNLIQQQLRHAACCDARKCQCKVTPLGSPMQMCHWAWTQYVSNLPELALQPSQLAGVALSRQRSYECAVHPCKDVGYDAVLRQFVCQDDYVRMLRDWKYSCRADCGGQSSTWPRAAVSPPRLAVPVFEVMVCGLP